MPGSFSTLAFILACFMAGVHPVHGPGAEVSVPLYTIHSGEVTVPLALSYTPSGSWTFIAGSSREDDAGNRVEFTDTTIQWPQGSIRMCRDSMVVFDESGNRIKTVSFGRTPDGRLSLIKERSNLTHFSYLPDGIAVRRPGKGAAEYRFDASDRVVSVCGLSESGYWLKQELQYAGDTLTVCASDSSGVVEKAVFLGCPQVWRKEEYNSREELTRSITYLYENGLPAGEIIQVYCAGDGRMPTVSSRRLSYSPGSPYPVSESVLHSDGTMEKTTFTYSGHRPGALLSVSHWSGGVKTDSTRIVYSRFPGHGGRRIIRPSAVLYGRGDGPLDTCVRYITYDFNGVHSYRSKRGHRFFPDPRIVRIYMPDPYRALAAELRAHVLSTGMFFKADEIDGDSVLFDKDGNFLSRVHCPEAQVIMYQGAGAGLLTASFADPGYDPAMVAHGSRIMPIEPEDVDISMRKTGVYDPKVHGLIPACFFLLKASAYGGILDFAVNARHQVYNNVWYIGRTAVEGWLAHNNFNYGNMLWGASARATGIPFWVARLGADFSNFFLSPDNKWRLDDLDDILSIRAGYHYLEEYVLKL